MQDHELIPGVALGALGVSERLVVGAMRLIAAGRGRCPMLVKTFEAHLGSQGEAAARGVTLIAHCLPAESQRKLTLGWLCVRGLTWDEAAILALVEAAQRSDSHAIAQWLSRLGLGQASPTLQRGIAWTAAALVTADQPLDGDVASLTRASASGIGHIRDQIETQFGGRAF